MKLFERAKELTRKFRSTDKQPISELGAFTILYIEEKAEDASLVKRMFLQKTQGSVSVTHVRTLIDAFRCLKNETPDLLFYGLPSSDSRLDGIKSLKETIPGVPIIAFIDPSSEYLVPELIKAGARDHLIKGHFNWPLLSRLMLYIREKNDLLNELEGYRTDAKGAANAKAEFLSSMSHEIRTPLNSILGIADLLEDTQLDNHQLQYIQQLKRSSRYLLKLVNNVLDLSKMETGETKLTKERFELTELFEILTDNEIKTLCRTKGISFRLSIQPSMPPIYMTSDPHKIKQIMFHIVENALKFTNKGTVAVDVVVRRDPVIHSGELQINVRDTGIGIPAEKKDVIFETFTQADSSVSRKHTGAGLGLSISKRFCDLIGGKIAIESKPDQGTTVSVRIPVGLDRLIPKSVASSWLNLTRDRILVVSDNPVEFQILKHSLQAFDPERIDYCSESSKAIDKLTYNREGYTIFFVDCEMLNLKFLENFSDPAQRKELQSKTVFILPVGQCSADYPTIQKLQPHGTFWIKPVVFRKVFRALTQLKEQKTMDKLSLTTEQSLKGLDQPLRILIAEDIEDNRFVIDSFFKKTSHHVDFAENGEAALAKITQSPYDLILMDIQMPGMDGYTATEKIRKWEVESKKKPTPIIALTAHALVQEMEKARMSGFDDYLTKPIGYKDLMKKVSEFILKESENNDRLRTYD